MRLVDQSSQTNGKVSPDVANKCDAPSVTSTSADFTFQHFLPNPIQSQSKVQTGSRADAGEHVPGAAILLVEDQETLRTAVVTMLRKRGFEVVEAGDGTSAVDQLRLHGERITLLMLDVTLPGLPSRNVLEEARRIQPGMPVVLTSAFGQDVAESSFNGLYVDRFIRKPYRLAILAELLESVLLTR